MQPMHDNANGPRIKPEPGLENGGLSLPPFNASSGMTAQQRAAQNLQAQYGSRAAASINAIQSNLPQQAPQQQQQRSAGPPIPRPQMSTTQYQQAMADAAARQRAHLQSAGNAQTDGADEMDYQESYGIMKHIDDNGQEIEMGRVEIDGIIRRQIEAMGQRMEGGGLMLPLKKRTPTANIKKRKIAHLEGMDGNGGSNLTPGVTSVSQAPAQYDGGDEDDDEDDKANVLKEEELDEDAINSDLDDPDEGLNEEDDDDEAMGHIMLCMYDKVQRVKNKW
jgi:transcription initiation factor TFIIA large subunit